MELRTRRWRETGALPAHLLQPLLDLMVARALARHPRLLERMGLTGERRLLIEPEGLAPAFLLVCSARRIRLTVLGRGREHAARTADARIRGPFLDLIDLLGGGDDGDARFFSRVLSIEGDTEVVVALRNVIDTAELDPLRDLLPIPAPLAPLVRRGTSCLAGLARTAATDLGNVERVLLQIAGGDDGDLR